MADNVQVNVQGLLQAADQLDVLGQQMEEANQAAAPGITGVQAPGNDPISLCMKDIFVEHANQYLEYAQQGAQTHAAMVQQLRTSAQAFEDAEDDNSRSMSEV